MDHSFFFFENGIIKNTPPQNPYRTDILVREDRNWDWGPDYCTNTVDNSHRVGPIYIL